MESKEEDTGQWGRSVDVGSRAPPASPDSGLLLGGQPGVKESEEGSKERRLSQPLRLPRPAGPPPGKTTG